MFKTRIYQGLLTLIPNHINSTSQSKKSRKIKKMNLLNTYKNVWDI